VVLLLSVRESAIPVGLAVHQTAQLF